MDVRIWMMKREEVCKAYGTSSAGLHRGMAEGRYPKPYRTGIHSVRWKSNEVFEVIDNLQIAEPVQVAPGVRKGRKSNKISESVTASYTATASTPERQTANGDYPINTDNNLIPAKGMKGEHL